MHVGGGGSGSTLAQQRFIILQSRPLLDPDDLAILFDRQFMIEYAQQCVAGQPDYGIASPFLAAMYGFKQVGIRGVGKFHVGTEGRVQIGQYLAHDRDTVIVGLCQLFEEFRCHHDIRHPSTPAILPVYRPRHPVWLRGYRGHGYNHTRHTGF